MDQKPARGPVLTIFAALFTLLAISNISKPLSGGRGHFVFFGTRMSGTANAILGPLFGIYLLIYAVGIWRQKRWALPMAWAYAAYVLINMALFSMKTPQGSWNSPVSAIVYVSIALGVSWGSAILLTLRRTQLT
ncbi:MAG TPA: hypothetical protein VMH37_09860 [Candidatus Binataceae bacterium]|nr:hypothetical protein [Candidatus Binataceae bacterium]